MKTGTLYLVPTPIGNLGDITLRALEVLKAVDVIACEDTRRTLTLCTHFQISKPLISFHAHSPEHKQRQLLNRCAAGQNIALVSDAGTPGLSDPGFGLVQAATQMGVPVVSLPGATAAIPALVGSGLPTDRFSFIGFLPRRPSRAKKLLKTFEQFPGTIIVYESPYRTRETLESIESVWGPNVAVVMARELTKIHETWYRGTVSEVRAQLGDSEIKGEVVLLIHPTPAPEEPENS